MARTMFDDLPKQGPLGSQRTRQLTLGLKLSTPLFGGGAEARKSDPVTLIRSASVKSALRHWWRITSGARYSNAADLARQEAILWGSSEKPGLVSMKIAGNTQGRPVSVKSLRDDAGGSLKYALFPFIGDNRNPAVDGVENVSFELTLKCRQSKVGDRDVWQELLTALRAWLAFGGVGSRTRRGCGSLTVVDPQKVSGDPAFKELSLLPSTNDPAVIQQWMQKAFERTPGDRAWPVLAKLALIKRVDDPSALAAWTAAMSVMRELRQGVGVGRNPGEGRFPGRSRWPEPEAIRKLKGQRLPKHQPDPKMPANAFPRAELGMPIVFHFKDSDERGDHNREPGDTQLVPVVNGKAANRMSSPIILKAMPTLNGFVALVLPLKVPRLEEVTLTHSRGSALPTFKKNHVRDASFAKYEKSPLANTLGSAPENHGSAFMAVINHAAIKHEFKVAQFGEFALMSTTHSQSQRSQKLLAMAIGPVQDFIKAARKTRDLWFGSQLLSDISRKVAIAVAEACGGPECLIFPAIERGADLREGLRKQNVANVILAVVPDELADEIQRNVVDPAREAAKTHWRKQAEAARDELLKSSSNTGLRKAAWDVQVDDVIEFYAAWTNLPDDPTAYSAARQRVMKLLAGRKQCREFAQCDTRGMDGVPKSSLDGARESVLMPMSDEMRRRLRLRKREQLDCIGLTKRLATRSWKKNSDDSEPHFPSASRIAAQAWLEGCSHAAVESRKIGEEYGDLFARADELARHGVLHRVQQKLPGNQDRDLPADHFPFEGTIVFRDRYREFADELGNKDEAMRSLRLAADAVQKLEATLGVPDPYIAMLLADGDRVGETLSKMKQRKDHQGFSAELAKFAAEAKRIVEGEECRGILIYAGGDDVLAMVPVHRAVRCAQLLRDAFWQTMEEALQPVTASERPTLSVGIAIAHFMEPLEFVLDYARTAEMHAKEGDEGAGPTEKRNALAVHVHSRGGAPIKCRAQWHEQRGASEDSAGLPLDQRLQQWVKLLLSGSLPHRAAYELRALAQPFEHWPTGDALSRALQAESLRVLFRKQTTDGPDSAKVRLAQLLSGVKAAKDLLRVADELLVARRIYLAAKLAAHS